MKPESRIYVAGHRGLVGSAIMRKLKDDGHENLISRTSSELDLTDRKAVDAFFASEKPTHVFLAAARVGGILANSTYPVEFLRDNLAMELNVLESSHRHGVEKLLFLGSSCIYPKFADQPISEDSLLTGSLEPTNEPYAIAKIAGIKLCQAYRRQHNRDFISAMPTNLYGPGDNFDLETSHVLPALIRKFHEAKVTGASEVVVWGSGNPRREFLHVEDLADACVFLMENYSDAIPINVGFGEDVSIGGLAALVGKVVGFDGEIVYDRSKPDGTPRKLLDTELLKSRGWEAKISLEQGVAATYRWFLDNVDGGR